MGNAFSFRIFLTVRMYMNSDAGYGRGVYRVLIVELNLIQMFNPMNF